MWWLSFSKSYLIPNLVKHIRPLIPSWSRDLAYECYQREVADDETFKSAGVQTNVSRRAFLILTSSSHEFEKLGFNLQTFKLLSQELALSQSSTDRFVSGVKQPGDGDLAERFEGVALRSEGTDVAKTENWNQGSTCQRLRRSSKFQRYFSKSASLVLPITVPPSS